MIKKFTSHDLSIIGGFGCVWLFILIVGSFIAGYCVDYSIYSIMGKDIPFILDIVIGIGTNGVAIVVAIVCAILRLSGWEVPLWEN